MKGLVFRNPCGGPRVGAHYAFIMASDRGKVNPTMHRRRAIFVERRHVAITRERADEGAQNALRVPVWAVVGENPTSAQEYHRRHLR